MSITFSLWACYISLQAVIGSATKVYFQMTPGLIISFYTNIVWAKNILQKKVRKLQPIEIATKQSKRPKRPRIVQKMAKSNIKLHIVQKKGHQKAWNCNITQFLDKTM